MQEIPQFEHIAGRILAVDRPVPARVLNRPVEGYAEIAQTHGREVQQPWLDGQREMHMAATLISEFPFSRRPQAQPGA